MSSRRLRWNPNPGSGTVQGRIRGVRNSVENRVWPEFTSFGDYVMGAEQATTRVEPPDGSAEKTFSTTDGMHSEMVALGAMLSGNDWRLTDDDRVESAGASPITTESFRTDEPHCRFCSVFLKLLDLPIRDGKATKGNYNLAGNLTYSLPSAVRENPVVLGRVLNGNRSKAESLARVREELDVLINNDSGSWVLRIDRADGTQTFVTEDGVVDSADGRLVVTWSGTADGRSIDVQALDRPGSARQYLWRLAFKGIYEARE